VSPRCTESSQAGKKAIFAPATLMRLSAGAGREAQERIPIIQDASALTTGRSLAPCLTWVKRLPYAAMSVETSKG
jgi:hypothetical protein